jgi:hypothetical protein
MLRDDRSSHRRLWAIDRRLMHTAKNRRFVLRSIGEDQA